jgi:hypothetical protein
MTNDVAKEKAGSLNAAPAFVEHHVSRSRKEFLHATTRALVPLLCLCTAFQITFISGTISSPTCSKAGGAS